MIRQRVELTEQELETSSEKEEGSVTDRPASQKETRRSEPMTHAEQTPRVTCLTERPASGRTVELSHVSDRKTGLWSNGRTQCVPEVYIRTEV